MDWPTTLPHPKVEHRQTVEPRSLETQMESGRVRVRRKYEISVTLYEVTWEFTKEEYVSFREFFKLDLDNGTSDFELSGIGTVAFWGATYSFSRTDNNYSVSAVLEAVVSTTPAVNLPDLQYAFEDGVYNVEESTSFVPESNCRSYFTLKWDYVDSGGPGIIQTATSSIGPWFDYIEPVPTPAQNAAGVMEVVINNQFNATRYFRIVSAVNGLVAATTTVCPEASEIPLPDWSISNLNTGRGLVAISSIHEIYQPYSYLENPFISTTEMYVEPLARLEWESTIAVQSQIVSVANDPTGGSWKWTRNGADPTEDTFLPKYESLENNLSVGREDFGMVVKIRCFDGGCRSPVAVIAVDKRFDLQGNFVTSGVGGTITSSCDIPRTDSFQTWVDGVLTYLTWTSGNDCDEAHNGVLTYTNNLYSEAANLSGGISSSRNIYTRIKSNEESASGEWPHINIAATNWSATQIAQVYRNSYWDLIPKVCEYLEQDSTENPTPVFSLLATPATSGNAGVGGSLAAAETASAAFIASRAAGTDLGTDTYSQWDYLLSVINEFGNVSTTFAPDPPTEPSVYGDDFEEYSDSSELTTGTLAAGTGWTAAWELNESSVEYGYDFFLDLGDVAFDYTGGVGWTGAWETADGSSYEDDFEDYSDGVVNGENGILNAGTGWATSSGFQVGWFGTVIEPGLDNFESYADSSDIANLTDPSATALTGGTGWGDVSGWVVNE